MDGQAVEVEGEPSNRELLAKYPNAQTRAEALELWKKDAGAAEHRDDEADFQAAKVEQEPDHEIERRERRAELARHPHTLLRGILSNLQSPAAQRGDITTKYAYLHSSVVQLAQLILGATPPPGDSEEKINEDFERQRQHAEGAEQQEPARH